MKTRMAAVGRAWPGEGGPLLAVLGGGAQGPLHLAFGSALSRLSYSFLPRATAISTLTFPFRKYIRVGIKVNPFSRVLPIKRRISSR